MTDRGAQPGTEREADTESGRRLDRWLRDNFFASTPSAWVPMIRAIEAEMDTRAAEHYDEVVKRRVAEAHRQGRETPPIPIRIDLADTLCFLRRHEHDDYRNCSPSRIEADKIVRALSARYDYARRAALAADPRPETSND